MKNIIFVILLMLSFSYLSAQNVNEQKYRLGLTLEQSGDYARASEVYSELVKADPDNLKYLFSYVKAMKAMNRYNELLPSLESAALKNESPELLMVLGEIYWRSGKPQQAEEQWNKTLQKFGDKEIIYGMVSRVQTMLGLYDKAIATLTDARARFKSGDIFATELIDLYIALGNYKKGADEIISFLYRSMNVSLAQGKLYALMVSEDAEAYIDNKIEKEAEKDPENYLAQEMYAWRLNLTKKFDKALEVYALLDKLQNAKGRTILTFADVSRNDENYDIAIKAYQKIIDLGQSSPYGPTALYGLTRTLEDKMNQGENISKTDAQDIIERYRSIIKNHPNSSTAADSKYRIAYLSFENLGEVDKAIFELNDLLRSYSRLPAASAASLLLGEIFVFNNDLAKAEEVYRHISSAKTVDITASVEAKYRLAELEYFKGNIDSAIALFNDLTDLSESDVANNALSRIVFLENNKFYSQGIKEFSSAELKEKQKKYKEAVESYRKAAEYAQFTDIYEKAVINASKLLKDMRNYDEAKKLMEELLEDAPETIYADYVNMFLADIYELEQKYDKALEIYTNVLVKFPKSIYVTEARNKIKALRSRKL